MAKEVLDSDRINYLIWRYLVESDYKETAVRLQQEWNTQDPQQLPFAPHVTNHALVAVLNRGLLYNVQERDLTQLQEPPRDVPAPASGFFGPLMPASPPAEAEEDHENLRKRQIDSDQPQQQQHHQPGPPVKRPRLSNGYENGFESTAMDVDEEQNGDENAYPSPEQLPSPVVATIGPEQGTQVEKVNELSGETIFLELSEEPSSKNVVLLQCEFNPRDPSILAAAGTDALARMWTLSRSSPDSAFASGSESPGKTKTTYAPHHHLLDDGVSPNTTVTGLAWSSNGSVIAVSSEPIEDGTARIEFWLSDGMLLATFNGFDSPVICLRWNPSNTSCLALSPQEDTREDTKSTVISVMHPTLESIVKYHIPNHNLHDQPLEATWTGDGEFFVCGGDILQEFLCVDNAITPGRKFETTPGEILSKITYDARSHLLATASESGTISIWDQSGQCRSFNAHQGLITSLTWQPLQTLPGPADETERYLASAGEDGAISIWNVRSSDTKSKSSMTMGSAVVALAFTPDGAFIAGGTNDRILIWKADDVNLPRATWTRGDEVGWRTPQSHDSGSDELQEDQFSLCWDADGQRLAYGVNSRLAVIDFRR
ncbi:WD repeat protein [Leptodontidium sp. 2 PMI_412]|nr:lish protein [Leptodontidium sp. MPI-SDFR-AT-0119]KAH9212507.1 WD repeat protein [Leptodontidium sp. 2 PMI_412]